MDKILSTGLSKNIKSVQLESLLKDKLLDLSIKMVRIGSKMQSEESNVKRYLEKKDYTKILVSAEKLKSYSIVYDSLRETFQQLLIFAKELDLNIEEKVFTKSNE